MSLTLLVVDDSFAMRTLISDLLISDPAVTVVETARSGVEAILSSLPADFPLPILVVQHMPNRFFIEQFAERLDRRCHLRVKVACDAEPVEPGTVTLAPPGFRLTVEQRTEDRVLRLTEEEPGALTPSIDATLKSVAEVYGPQAIGIILSGMGHDGTQGMQAIKAAGGVTLCEDESALLFGMPKSAIEAGCADYKLPMEKIPEALAELISAPWKSQGRFV